MLNPKPHHVRSLVKDLLNRWKSAYIRVEYDGEYIVDSVPCALKCISLIIDELEESNELNYFFEDKIGLGFNLSGCTCKPIDYVPMTIKQIEEAIEKMFFEYPTTFLSVDHMKNGRTVAEYKICNIDVYLGEVWDRAICLMPFEKVYPVDAGKDRGFITIVEPGTDVKYHIFVNIKGDERDLEIAKPSSCYAPGKKR